MFKIYYISYKKNGAKRPGANRNMTDTGGKQNSGWNNSDSFEVGKYEPGAFQCIFFVIYADCVRSSADMDIFSCSNLQK
jgi:hypothetical protein